VLKNKVFSSSGALIYHPRNKSHGVKCKGLQLFINTFETNAQNIQNRVRAPLILADWHQEISVLGHSQNIIQLFQEY
jgi:hypothetical protein